MTGTPSPSLFHRDSSPSPEMPESFQEAVLMLASEICKTSGDIGRWFGEDQQLEFERDQAEWSRASLDPSDSDFVLRVLKSINASLADSKRGKPEDSLRYLLSLETKLRSVPLFRKSQLLVESVLYATLAYAHYRMHSAELADLTLLRVTVADEELEFVYGWHSRHMHRIHMVENRMTVYLKSGNIKPGYSVALELLDYLSGNSDHLSYPGTWGSELVQKLDQSIVESKAISICCRLAFFLSSADAAHREMFANLFADFCDSKMTLLPKKTCVKYWARAKIAFLKHNNPEFLKTVHQWWLSDPSGDLRLVADVLLDLSHTAKRLGILSSFQSEIVPHVRNWGIFPSTIKRQLLEVTL